MSRGRGAFAQPGCPAFPMGPFKPRATRSRSVTDLAFSSPSAAGHAAGGERKSPKSQCVSPRVCGSRPAPADRAVVQPVLDVWSVRGASHASFVGGA